MNKKATFFLFAAIFFLCYQNIILAQDEDIKQYFKGIKPPDDYQTGKYVAANLFWDLLPTVRFGIEYLWGERVNKNGDSGTANRINFMAKFNF